MKAENVPAAHRADRRSSRSPYIENKATVHPAWPSFTSERGRAIQYGAEMLPADHGHPEPFRRPVDRPEVYARDTDDIMAAIRKVYPKIMA